MKVEFVAALFLSLCLAVGSVVSRADDAGQSEQAVRDSIKAEGKRLLISGDTDVSGKHAAFFRLS
ncbi:MAG: hypothetical protein ACLPTF_09290 [Steroidobacteraceae bacterium]